MLLFLSNLRDPSIHQLGDDMMRAFNRSEIIEEEQAMMMMMPEELKVLEEGIQPLFRVDSSI
ncbi:hypothetical protein LguiB_024247 [Lonicera macranthoides]